MNKEQRFEKIEKKIKEAANNNIVAFDAASWTKMEALLDKDKKRRFFYWYWIALTILILASGLFYYNFSSQSKTASTKISDNKTAVSSAPLNNNNNNTAVAKNTLPEDTNLSRNTALATYPKPENPIIPNAIPKNQTSKKSAAVYFNDKLIVNKRNAKSNQSVADLIQPIIENKDTNTKLEQATPVKESVSNENISKIKIEDLNKAAASNEKKADPKLVENERALIKKNQENIVAIASSTNKLDSVFPENKNTANTKKLIPNKNNKKPESKFYLQAKTGIDWSNTNLLKFSNSQAKTQSGFAIGYRLSKKISLQTGFYLSDKKYSAAPEYYHPRPGSYLSTIALLNVDADCLVYDIPVGIRYRFLEKKSMSYFAAISVSSYIMKKENYVYSYYRNGVLVNYPYSYTGNDHLFSNANFSFGLVKKISEKFSVLAEPGISVPIYGVGAGKVKLYSTSMQLGIQYNPRFK